MTETKEKLPLELLKEKYIPVVQFPDRYGISVARVMSLVNTGRIKRAEFLIPGERRRSLHVNYEEVLSAVAEDTL